MNIEITQEDDLSIVELQETRLDAAAAPAFKKAMEELIRDGNLNIILDISRLEFMDSSSLGAMVSILKRLGSEGDMVLLGAKGLVAELFHLTRMDQVFSLVDDLEEAKDELS